MDTALPRADFERARNLLHRDILSGALSPNSKLRIRDLSSRYGIGASPMREALSQLAVTGIVDQHAQRGFRVPALSIDDLFDITTSRQIIEAEALRLSIENATSGWEDEIVASFHIFEREVFRFYSTQERDFDTYETHHHRFHRALIEACPLPSLKSFCNALYIRATRYRRLTRSYAFSKEPVIEEHRILKDAVLARRSHEAIKALHSHIGLTAELAGRLIQKT